MQPEPTEAEINIVTSPSVHRISNPYSQHGKHRADDGRGESEGLRPSLFSPPPQDFRSNNESLRHSQDSPREQENEMSGDTVFHAVTATDCGNGKRAVISTEDDATRPAALSAIEGGGNGVDATPRKLSSEISTFETAGDVTPSRSLSGDHGSTPLLRSRPTAELEHHPSADRITQYEKALLTSPSKRSEPLGFQVVKSRVVRPGVSKSPLAEFPNEVLTHVLSYLPPSSLSAVALVSRRFRDLVTTPHSWRVAFSRFFPGSDAFQLMGSSIFSDSDSEDSVGELRSERRVFTRLSALASWRSEYILRTRLLRSLGRGKPVQLQPSPGMPSRAGATQGNAVNTYYSQHYTTANHIHVSFGAGLNKKLPKFIHGADEDGSSRLSDPLTGKVDAWGLTDPQRFLHFADTHPGDAPYGLGAGEIIGAPNVMDVSQPFGSVYGEGTPGGSVYYRSTEEMRGRFLLGSVAHSVPEKGVPKVPSQTESITSVWIAKSSVIPSISDGLIGILSGTSCGIVTAYSFGADALRDQRLDRGEITARWVLSPGVPIISIVVDEMFSEKRYGKNRIWAVALNALGEVFYLSDFPKRPQIDRQTRVDLLGMERLAWTTGRTVQWTLVEPTRRLARVDPYSRSEVDGSYTPRSSWDGVGLGREQLVSETREIEKFLNFPPKHFCRVCEGWDMRRLLEVDFAGDDGNGAGEAVFVIGCGLDQGNGADLKRFVRFKVDEGHDLDSNSSTPQATPAIQPTMPSKKSSLFGGPVGVGSDTPPLSPSDAPGSNTAEVSATDKSSSQSGYEEWRISRYDLGALKAVQITTSGLDTSTYAQICSFEDPLLNISGLSTASTPLATPPLEPYKALDPSDVPGHRARFLAVGTKTGSVIVWNMRASAPASAEIDNIVTPIRVIHTDSPQISCLALSALYLVHGGNDGLVQAWDPLASTLSPIRTLHSRFSSRARRRLVQAEASVEGVGINLFAAGVIFLDPDPTVLRGMVSLGTYLRYWSYSSSAAEQYKSQKRRLRRSERGSNVGGDRYSGTGRGALRDYIANEQHELELEKRHRRREAERFAGRFGTELLGRDATEEDILAYAAMLSEESLKAEQERRESEIANLAYSDATRLADVASPNGAGLGIDTSATTPSVQKPEGVSSGAAHLPEEDSTYAEHLINDEELDPELAQAIRLSLEDAAKSPAAASHLPDIPVRWGKGAKPRSPSWQLPEGFDPAWLAEDNVDVEDVIHAASSRTIPDTSNGLGPSGSGPGPGSAVRSPAEQQSHQYKDNVPSTDQSQGINTDMSDLDFALQLSLAEEQSRREAEAGAQAQAQEYALLSADNFENGNGPVSGSMHDDYAALDSESAAATILPVPEESVSPTAAYTITHAIPRKNSSGGDVATPIVDDKDFPALPAGGIGGNGKNQNGQRRRSRGKGKGRA